MCNFNDWTWADSSYVAHTVNSVMTLGNFSTEYNSTTMATHQISPKTTGSYLFRLSEFGFGKTDLTAQTEYYEDILNNDPADYDTYGEYSNTTSFAMNFRGLGLPTKEFNKFSNLISLATQGESTCLSYKGGYCVLSKPCSDYDTLWDYSFKLRVVDS